MTRPTVMKFTRGDDFSCIVTVDINQHVSIHNIKTPDNTTSEVMQQFLEDAEAAAIKKYSEVIKYG